MSTEQRCTVNFPLYAGASTAGKALTVRAIGGLGENEVYQDTYETCLLRGRARRFLLYAYFCTRRELFFFVHSFEGR